MFQIEKQDQAVILVPQRDLREFEFGEIEDEGSDVLRMIDQGEAQSVIVDFQKTDYYGSTALSFFVKLWKRVRANGGKMAFCNVSAHELEILEMTKLDNLWSLCSTRDEALRDILRRET